MRGNEIIPLSDQAALIGTDGWACGTGGIEWRTPVRLNDDLLIDELRRQSTHTARYALIKRVVIVGDRGMITQAQQFVLASEIVISFCFHFVSAEPILL